LEDSQSSLISLRRAVTRRQEAPGVWEDAGDTGAALDFLIQTFRGVGGAQARAVFRWQREEGETFGDVSFEPVGQFLGGGAMFGRQALEQGIGPGCTIRSS
jgi:hypothetical protein